MNALRNIVAGLDFSPASKEALDQAARIAAWNGATLHVLHVVDGSMLNSVLGFLGLGTDQSWDAIRDDALRLAKQVAAEGRLTEGARVDVHVGSPIDLLVRAVKAHAADLLVLGIHKSESDGPGGGRGPGPVATACLRHAPTKVLLAREGHSGPYKSVVACTDFSDTSFQAVQMAVRVAQRDKSALRIVHVAMPPRMDMAYAGNPLGIWPGQPLKVMEMWNSYRSSLQPQLEKFVEPLKHDMSALNVTLDITEHEHYGRGITAYAKEHKAELLVLGNQGRTNLRYALLGSTAERALAELPCSALVVKLVETATAPAEAPTHPDAAVSSPGRWQM
ncbi:MAG: universal stress protein [Vicinamibacterales bacterium]